MCASPTTAQILTTWDREGDTAGFKAYRAALAATARVMQPSLLDFLR